MSHTWLLVQAKDPESPPDGRQSLNHGLAEQCSSSQHRVYRERKRSG
jgi:hypothetical protein